MLLVNEKGEQIVSHGRADPVPQGRAGRAAALDPPRRDRRDPVGGAQRHPRAGADRALRPRCSPRSCSPAPSPAPCAGSRRRPRTSRRNIKARHELPELSHRADEVGQMAAAFREMTASLYRRIEASERFAQDVAHELQEPADRRALDRRGAGLRQDARAAAGAGAADPGGAEAPQQAHHRRLQRLAARCRAGAAGDRAGRRAPGAAGRGRGASATS